MRAYAKDPDLCLGEFSKSLGIELTPGMWIKVKICEWLGAPSFLIQRSAFYAKAKFMLAKLGLLWRICTFMWRNFMRKHWVTQSSCRGHASRCLPPQSDRGLLDLPGKLIFFSQLMEAMRLTIESVKKTLKSSCQVCVEKRVMIMVCREK